MIVFDLVRAFAVSLTTRKKHWTSDMGVGPTVIRAVFLTVGLLVSCETASSNNTVACSICPR